MPAWIFYIIIADINIGWLISSVRLYIMRKVKRESKKEMQKGIGWMGVYIYAGVTSW